MKSIYNKVLIFFLFKPYKTVRLETGLLVKHFRSGYLLADEVVVDGRIIKETTYHG